MRLTFTPKIIFRLLRQRVNITYDSWKELTKDQKGELVMEILQSF